MALTNDQYRTMRDLFRGVLSVDSANPTDTDVLTFFKQLLTEAIGAVALSNPRQFLAGEIARRILSGNFSNPTDANVVDFWTALTSAANAGAAMGATAQYQTMKKALLGEFSKEFFNPTPADILSYFSTYADINFGALMPGVVLYLRGDLGLSKTGNLVNTWANQAGAGSNVTEGTVNAGIASATGSVGGRGTLISDGTTQYGTFNNLGLVAPATTPFHYYAVARFLTSNPPANHYLTGAADFSALITQLLASNQCEYYNGNTVVQTTALNTWARFRVSSTGSASDVWRWGATDGTGASFGNNAPNATRGLFADHVGGNKGTWELALFLVGITSLATFNAALPALDAAVSAFYGAGNVAL